MAQLTEIEETAQNASKSVAQQLYDATLTPYPAWGLAAALLATPLATSQPQAVQIRNAQAGSGYLFSAAKKRLHVGPTTVSSVLFGGAMALGGWISSQGDVESASGFITAWSSLYLIVNGRQAFNGIRYGRLWPVFLSTAALGEAYFHGKRFLYGIDDLPS